MKRVTPEQMVSKLHSSYDVAAYYWPAYHDAPRWRPFFRGREGEWEIIRNAQPKFPGHWQPRVPLWGYEEDSSPDVMEKKINAAADHNVNVMIFDWYWYENQPFLEESINAFLQAPSIGRIKFFLMWANHDATTLWDLEKSHEPGVIWPGATDRETFEIVTDRVITRFMKHASYYRIENKPVFSIYDLSGLIHGLGGLEQTKEALESFRAKSRRAGLNGLHLQAILWGAIPATSPADGDPATQNHTLQYLGFDSVTNYQWCHHVLPKGPYAEWASHSIALWNLWNDALTTPYFPHVSIGWDTNPRFKALQDAVVDELSPEVFADCLRQARAFIDRHHLQPPLVTINSWNEWGEGSYLEPDTRFGMKYLEAVRDVFGR